MPEAAKAKLRRIALKQQGLLGSGVFGRGRPAVLRAIEHIGYVQIDTISVVERAHHHVLWSRVPNYRPEYLDRLVRERDVFEYWFHAASYLPMRDYRFALPRMHAIRAGERHWYRDRDEKLMAEILRRVRDEGPLRARDFEDPREGSGEWWSWKPAKQALEQLFMQGELMACGREGFQKIYDLPERVLPVGIDTREPSTAEYAAYLIDTNLRAHGFATAKTFTYLRKGAALRDAVRDELAQRLDAGLLVEVVLRDGALAYADPELLESRAPRSGAAVKFLSPFDNAVIQRERGRGVFDFDYQIECYVPAAKRRFGYFCLPILYRDRLVGRVDCKAHRADGRLELKAVFVEGEVDDGFAGAFAEACWGLAGFNRCDEIALSAVQPLRWRRVLDEALWSG